eukprot:83204_1
MARAELDGKTTELKETEKTTNKGVGSVRVEFFHYTPPIGCKPRTNDGDKATVDEDRYKKEIDIQDRNFGSFGPVGDLHLPSALSPTDMVKRLTPSVDPATPPKLCFD